MVQLAQLAGNEKTKSGAALPTGKKRLENPIDRMRLDAGAAIGDVKKRPVARVHPAELDLNLHTTTSLAVLQRVLAQIPNHLVQVTGIKMHLEVICLFQN